ncbi:MAG TPA: ATP-binding protein [Chitinophaga sp.]|uniref:sensor histidine kinase n=1 Tax=Chitinophaga sp. TaxID=1869181 RepID=UPI002DBEE7E5|nr:ATP-binding protein [Chitinophaga sp.]HEU4552472.1 ATP-binding protein [Chitinophaga sp.]
MENYKIVTGMVIAIIFFLLLGFFIFLLVAYYNSRKKRFIEEKLLLQTQFNEQLLKSQLEIQESIFNNISQEIHDNVGQILSLAKVQLSTLEQSDGFNPALVADAKESIGKALADLRDIAKSLSTDRAKGLSLPDMTRHELDRINRAGLLDCHLSEEGPPHAIDGQKKLILFRIIQEALQNIIKHAGARTAAIVFTYQQESMRITIQDNGGGFDTSLTGEHQGLGLQNITSRARLVGGAAVISSTPGKGTVITINAPYE